MSTQSPISEIGDYLKLAGDSIKLGSKIAEVFSSDPRIQARRLRRRAARHLSKADRLTEKGRAQWRINRQIRLATLDWTEAQKLDPIDVRLAAALDKSTL